MDRIDILKRENLYKAQLSRISDVKFTFREMDIIACILHNRGEKKIGSLLDISYRTVGVHSRNIMSKIGTSSREYLIDFIEKSGKLKYVREYYNCLIIESYFKAALSKIRMISKSESYSLNAMASNEKQKLILEKIFLYLECANVSISIKEESSNNKDFFELQNLSKEKSSKNILINLSNENIDKKDNYEIIDFAEDSNFFFKILDIIKITHSNPGISKIIGDFEKEYSCIANSSSLVPDDLKNRKILKPRNTYKYALIFTAAIAILVGLFFTIDSSVKQSSENKQSWNLPLLLRNYVNRPELTNKIDKKIDAAMQDGEEEIIIGLTGLGGIGKSTLANYYIHHSKRNYAFRVWFNAESKETLNNHFLEIGAKYNIFTDNIPISQKILSVKEFLASFDSAIIVYDNALNMESIEEYLPSKGHIIITSRNYNMPNAIQVGVMNISESTKLLDNLMPKEAKKKENYKLLLEELANKLDKLPLALTQAGAYINLNAISIDNYISFFESEESKLLSSDVMPSMDHHKPAYVSWELILKDIDKDPKGKVAIDLLDFISVCNAEQVPRKLLSQYLYHKTDSEAATSLFDILKLLQNYSLVNISHNGVSIHRLVQSWRLKTLTKEEKLSLVRKGVTLIEELYPRKNQTTEDVKLIRALLPHAEMFFFHLGGNKDTIDHANIYSIVADFVYTLGEYGKSKEYVENAIKIYQKSYPNNKAEIAYFIHQLGMTYRALGEYEYSRRYLYKALKLKRDLYKNDNLEVAYTLYQIGKTYRATEDYNLSKKYLDESLNIRERLLPKKHLEIAHTYHQLAKTHRKLGNYKIAEKLLLEDLKIKKQNLGEDHMEVAHTYHQLGTISHLLGNYLQSIDFSKKALKYFKENLGEEHIVSSDIIYQMGVTYREIGNFTDSIKYLEHDLKINMKNLGKNHISVFYPLHQLGITHRKMKNYNRSLDLLNKALDLKSHYLTKDHLEIAYTLDQLGVTNMKVNNCKKSRELFNDSLKIKLKHLPDQHLEIAYTLYRMGAAHNLCKKYDGAIALLEKSLKMREEILGEEHIKLSSILFQLSKSYKAKKDYEKSKSLYRRAKSIIKKFNKQKQI